MKAETPPSDSTKLKKPQLPIVERYPQVKPLLTSKSLLRIYQAGLQQFHLEWYYCADDVMNEVVVRLEKTLDRGKPIRTLDAWMRAVGFNYIRELSRIHKKAPATDFSIIESHASEFPKTMEEDIGFECQRVRAALAELKPKEREILELKFFEHLSSNQIAYRLTKQGDKITPEAVRKREERALKRLRKIYGEKNLA